MTICRETRTGLEDILITILRIISGGEQNGVLIGTDPEHLKIFNLIGKITLLGTTLLRGNREVATSNIVIADKNCQGRAIS